MLKIPRKYRTVKFCLTVVTVLFLLTGIVVLSTGAAVRVVYNQYELFVTERFFSLTGFVIATGVIIILGSALGFYAAYSEQFYFVAGYVVLMLVILVFEMAALITSFGLSKGTASEIRSPMTQTLNQYESRQEIAVLWDTLQMGFECCGVAGRHDWSTSRIPISCCHIDFGTISPFECTTANAYTTGCSSALSDYLSGSANAMAVILLVVFSLQVLMTAASGWLAYRSRFEEVELES